MTMHDHDKNQREWASEVAKLRRQLREVEAERDALAQEQRQRRHLQYFLDLLPEVAFVSDLQWRLRVVNEAFLKMHGFKREAVIGKSLSDLQIVEPAVFSANGPSDVAKMLRGGQIRNVERKVIDKDGISRDVLISISPLLDGDGQPHEMLIVARDIGDLKAAKAAREDSLQRYRLLFETGCDAAIILDFDTGRVEDVNQRACELLESSRDQVIGMHFTELHPEEERARHRILFQSMASGASGPTGDCHVLTAKGRCVPVEIVGGLFEWNGRTHAIGIFRDVTEQKQAAEAIRLSEERHRDLIDGMVEVIISLDLDTCVTSVNPAVTRTLGYEPDELLGHPFIDLVIPENREAIGDLFARVISGQDIRFETVLIGKEGRTIHVECSATPVTKDGQVIGLQGVLWDITLRKLLESKLRESEERYRTLVESAGEAIAMVNRDGMFLFMNSTAARRLGGAPSDYVGKTMWELFPPGVAAGQMAFIRGVIESGQGSNSVSLSHVGGELRWYNTTVEPVRDSRGDVASALVIARDIHKFKKAQEELDAYRERFARAEQLASVGTLSATLAHELTQPLTVIRLSIQNSLEDLQGASCPDRVIEDLKDGLAELESVTAIAERFRNYARRASEKTMKKVALKDIVRRVVVLLQEGARRSNVAMEIDGMDGLPEISAYEKDLEQLVFALAQNAIQAADGRKEAYCRISGTCQDGCIELRVSDNCGGISPESLPHVFEPFFTTKPAGEGTGLGLCIVQRVVSQAHGQVRVESDYGQGSTFIVTLPLDAD